MTRRPPARRGLSLLEVLLALAILSLAMAAIGKLVDVGTDRGNDARFTTRGTRLAQSKMAEVSAGLIPISGGTSGQFDNDDGAWSFEVASTPATPPNLYTVTVTVSRSVQGRTTQLTLSQMMFDPTQMGTAAQAEATTSTTGTTGSTGTGSSTGAGGSTGTGGLPGTGGTAGKATTGGTTGSGGTTR
jgi:prepilin-type N-terminal cleavage/methylation domain-containing protein